jgi:D-serine deaminase-like pyridoxal phosphate-dependent protein
MHVSELDTPALVIDLDIMERNLRRVAEYCSSHALRLRPHTKTHKVPAVGRRQLDSGAAGLTVAKVGEAEVMLDANPPDLLVAYPVIGRNKLARLMQVAKKTKVTVALDSLGAARQLSEAAREAKVSSGECYRLRPAVQLSTTVIGVSVSSGSPKMNRWPSALTPY